MDDVTVTPEVQETKSEVVSEITDIKESNDFANDINFFGEKAYSEAELAGEEKHESSIEKVAVSESSEGDKTTDAPKPVDDKKTEEKDIKPPDGYVAKEEHENIKKALKEERNYKKSLQKELESLKSMVEQLQTVEREKDVTPVDDEFTDFKVLTRDEYNKMVEEDFVEAQKYLHDLKIFEDRQRKIAFEKEQQEKHSRYLDQILTDSKTAIEKEIPGIFDEDDPINNDLIEFSTKHGMDKDYLLLLSDPATRVMDAKGNTYLMGKGSVGLLKMLYNTYKNGQELRKQITEEVQAEFVKKIKDSGKDSFLSIGDFSKAGSQDFETGKLLSETEFARLTPEKRRKYLGG